LEASLWKKTFFPSFLAYHDDNRKIAVNICYLEELSKGSSRRFFEKMGGFSLGSHNSLIFPYIIRGLIVFDEKRQSKKKCFSSVGRKTLRFSPFLSLKGDFPAFFGSHDFSGDLEEDMAEDKLREGIYLQIKKSTIGTGSTAKHTEYRNFWATLRVEETHVEMILLDDAFTLTGIREKFAVEELSGCNWLFVEQGEKKYCQLKPKLSNILNPPPKAPKPHAPFKPAPPKPGAAAPAANIFGAQPKKPQPNNQQTVVKKGGWWDNK
jgi:hypothetical protein